MTAATTAAVVSAGTSTPAVEPKPAKKPGPKRREFRSDWSPGAYRFTLDLDDRQEAALTRAVGAARFAFNAALAEVKANLDTRSAEKAQWGEPVTEPLNWSAYGLRAVWTGVRDGAAPWWGQVPKWAFDTGTAQCADALKNWAASKNGTRAGRPVGFPRFRSRRRPGAQSIRITSHDKIKVGAVQGARDNRHIVLPGGLGGQVRTRENLKRLTRRLTSGSAAVTGATISRTPSGRWAVTIHVQQHQPVPVPGHGQLSPTGAPPSGTTRTAGPEPELTQEELLEPAADTHEPAGRSSSSSSSSSRSSSSASRPSSSCPSPLVGVDLGVGAQNLMVVADPDGVEVARVENPKALDRVHSQIVRLQKKIGRAHRVAVAEGRVDAAGRPVDSQRVLALRARIARLHRRAADIRTDSIHKATSALVAAGHTTVGIETLHVAGMMASGGARKKGLNRAVADAALGEIGRQVGYKTEWAGISLVHTGRWFPSSKMCSRCAAVKPKLPLAVREYRCDNCGLVIDRDLNAAANLARVAVDPAWETSGWVPTAAGSSRQHQPGGEPGTGKPTSDQQREHPGRVGRGSRRKPSGADGGNGADPHQGRELRTLTSAAAGAGPHGEGTGTRHGGTRLSHQSQQD